MMETICRRELPQSMGFEWTELTLQQIKAGESTMNKFVFPLAVVFVFLVLSAQYESWSLPLSIILIVPMCLLAAIAGVWLCRMDNNIFTQIGLVVLIGLASKNAILIVEFAQRAAERRQAAVRGHGGCLPPASAADPDDLLRLYLGRGAPADFGRAPAPKCAWPWAWACSAACWG